MATRLDLQTKLEELLGSRNVYYQAPSSTKIEYPAIRYSKRNYYLRHANDRAYYGLSCYEIIVISKQPEHPVIRELMNLQYCSYDRHYVSDNLNHDVLTLYF